METKFHEKGAEGEKYIAQEIAALGYKVLYVGGCQLFNITGGRYYSVDLAPFGKGKSFWVQAKFKEPRDKYPDTGMELWRYKHLIKHETESGLPCLVLFTDRSKRIYGEWVKNLESCVSNTGRMWNRKDQVIMIYWLVERLKDLKDLI